MAPADPLKKIKPKETVFGFEIIGPDIKIGGSVIDHEAQGRLEEQRRLKKKPRIPLK